MIKTKIILNIRLLKYFHLILYMEYLQDRGEAHSKNFQFALICHDKTIKKWKNLLIGSFLFTNIISHWNLST